VTAALEIADLHIRYGDGTAAVRGVSLSVPAGGRVAVIGPNGAGKTSLMLAVMNGVPFTGRIAVGGVELSSRTAADVRANCGLIFQNADEQLFMPTLLEDVAFGPLNQGLSANDAHTAAMAALAEMGLEALAHKPAHHLSGGQKRLAALATVLAMRVQLLLLDEPGANLDYRSRRRLVSILSARPEAMLLATHDLAMVRELCQQVVLLEDGKVVAAGPTTTILADTELLNRHGVG
jgi:cobalt/nickel transport system ATP-binding protein